MDCKFCQQPLEDGVLVCPACGKSQEEETAFAPEEETVTEQAAEPVEEHKEPQTQKGILLTPGKLALLIGTVVVLTALVVALILQGMGYNFSIGDTAETTAPVDTSPVGTVPPDGNAEDVTCKGTYTVTDEDVLAGKDTVVATAGEGKLTNAQLQIFYWSQVQSFLSEYGQYAYYYGMDYTQPLDTQLCYLSEEGLTWQQYFLKAALQSWHSYQCMANEAAASGMELTEEQQAELDAIPQSLATNGGLQGFDSAESYLAYGLGAGVTVPDYVEYYRMYYQGLQYFDSEYVKMEPTDEEVDAYFTQYEEEYAANGITRKTNATVDVRHILVLPEGATVETIYSETFSEEAWAAAAVTAQEIMEQWLAGEATEESFAELANTHSADTGSNTNGGLYEGVTPGYMVTNFDAWCFDEERQVGDCEIVETELGYHIMYFSGGVLAWPDYARSDILAERSNELIRQGMEKYPMEVDYKAIMLGLVDLG